MSAHLLDFLRNRQQPENRCITSVCGANPSVVRAALELHRDLNKTALIEATANQVNQFGAYTGMFPAVFRNKVLAVARSVRFPTDRLILGGDHLGPYPWRAERADEAMTKAREMVSEYVRAGYTKIHLDASMPLGGDEPHERGNWKPRSEPSVPPGYAASALTATIDCTRSAFQQYGLDDAWSRVIAIVVQPGVEFADQHVFPYNRTETVELRQALPEDSNLVFEGHSTDYQLPEHLQAMSEDSFSILKVGPALTFAFRKAIFLLGFTEAAVAGSGVKLSPTRLPQVLEHAMRSNPLHWRDFYDENTPELALNLLYSVSDRCRYYWSVPEVDRELKKLISNMEKHWPPIQLSKQFVSGQYWKVRRETLDDMPQSYIIDRIQEVLATYPGLS